MTHYAPDRPLAPFGKAVMAAQVPIRVIAQAGGVSERMVHFYMNGEKRPRSHIIAALSEFLNEEPEVLFPQTGVSSTAAAS